MTLRGLGYVRVSLDMQRDTYSLDAQRRAITDACASRGYTLSEIIADEGISARAEQIAKRPGLASVLAAVEAHRVDVVVVHSLDRLARNVLVMLTCFRTLAAHNVAFVSVTESLDYSTPEGKLQLTVLGAFASYFSDSLAKHTSKGKSERARQGTPNNRAPYGYTWQDGKLVISPDTGDAAREVWRLAATGLSDHRVADALGLKGFPMSREVVRQTVTSRTYLGETRWHKLWFPGKHAAMIDEATWQIVQAHRTANKRVGCGTRKQPPRYGVHVFGGLLTCARCGKHLNINADRYVCNGRRTLTCQQGYVRDVVLCEQFGTLLTRLLPTDDDVRAALATRPQPLPARRDAITARLDRLRKLYGWGDMDEADYRTETSALKAELARLDAVPVVGDVLAQAARLRDVAGLWANATPEERKSLAGSLVTDLLVDNRRIVGVRPQEIWSDVWQLSATIDERGYIAV